VARKIELPHDEHARHPTAKVIGDLITIAERPLQPLGEIFDGFICQPISPLRLMGKDTG
jgi:hypothetical protein